MVKSSRYAKTPPRRWPLAVTVLCVLLVAAGAAFWFFSSYTWVDSVRYSRSQTQLDLSGSPLPPIEELEGFKNLEVLDLRDTDLTVQQYGQLSQMYPQCDILWDVPFQGGFLDSSIENLSLSTLTEPDIAMLDYFPKLKTVDAAFCQDYAQLAALQGRRPEVRVDYSVRIGDKAWSLDTNAMSLTDPRGEELLENLAYLPALESLDLTGELPAPALLQELCQAYPAVDISWTLQLGEYSLTQDTTELELSGWTPESAEALEEVIGYVPSLQKLTLLGCGLNTKDLGAVQSAHPELDMVWDITMGKKTFLSTEETLDLSNVSFESIGQLEDLISSMPNLTWIDVSFCGLANEDLDELNRKLEDTRIVWTISIGKKATLRTDVIYFMPTKMGIHVVDADLTELKYCTDIVCIDIGHNDVTNIEFVRTMPHLKYMNITDCIVESIEPLRGLQELVRFEGDESRYTDLTPLLDCPALEEVHIGHTRTDVMVLAEAKQLKRLWYLPIGVNYFDLPELKEKIKAALPNTEVVYDAQPDKGGLLWNNSEHYRDLRDIMGMYYIYYTLNTTMIFTYDWDEYQELCEQRMALFS